MNQASQHHTTSVLPATLGEIASTFFFDDKPVRVIDRAGTAMFVAADVCAAIGTANVSSALKALSPDERTLVTLRTDDANTLGSSEGIRRGNPVRSVITEGAMYTLIFRSREATKEGSAPYRFRRWVGDVVLPSIRKTGAYANPAAQVPAPVQTTMPAINVRDQSQLQIIALQLLQVTQEQAAELAVVKAAVEAARPAVDFVEALTDSDGTWGLQDAGKALHQPPNKFVSWLKERHDVFERNGGNVAAQRLIERGFFTVVWKEFGGKPRPVTRLTGKGIVHYAKALGVRPPGAPAQALLPGL